MTPERLKDFIAHSEEWALVCSWLIERRERAGEDIDRTPDENSLQTARHKAIRRFIKDELLNDEFKQVLLTFFNEQRNAKA